MFKTSQAVHVCALVLAFLSGCTQSPEQLSPQQLILKSKNNRLAFDQYYCEFQVQVGTAASEEDVKNGKFTEIIGQMKGRSAKRGEELSTVVEESSIPTDAELPSIFPCFMYLGQNEFFVSQSGKSAVVGKRLWKFNPELSPWSMIIYGNGIMDELLEFRFASNANRKSSVENVRGIVRINVESMERLRADLDPKWNYLTVSTQDGMTLHKAKEIEGKGWFPEVKCWSNESDGRGKVWYRWELTKLELRQPIDDELSYTFDDRCSVAKWMDFETKFALDKGFVMTPKKITEVLSQASGI